MKLLIYAVIIIPDSQRGYSWIIYVRKRNQWNNKPMFSWIPYPLEFLMTTRPCMLSNGIKWEWMYACCLQPQCKYLCTSRIQQVMLLWVYAWSASFVDSCYQHVDSENVGRPLWGKPTDHGCQFVIIRYPSWWRNQMEAFSELQAFVRGFQRSPVDSPQKVQWRGDVSLMCAWSNSCANNGDAGNLRTIVRIMLSL